MVESVDEFIRRKNAEWERARERQKPFKTKDVGREGRHLWYREAWTWLPQHNYGEKVFVIERLRNVGQEGRRAFDGGARPGDIEYRSSSRIVHLPWRCADADMDRPELDLHPDSSRFVPTRWLYKTTTSTSPRLKWAENPKKMRRGVGFEPTEAFHFSGF